MRPLASVPCGVSFPRCAHDLIVAGRTRAAHAAISVSTRRRSVVIPLRMVDERAGQDHHDEPDERGDTEAKEHEADYGHATASPSSRTKTSQGVSGSRFANS